MKPDVPSAPPSSGGRRDWWKLMLTFVRPTLSDPRNLRRLQPGLPSLLRLHRPVELPVPHPGRDLQCQPAHEALQKVFVINAGPSRRSERLLANERR